MAPRLPSPFWRVGTLTLGVLCALELTSAQNIDGGRSELPGMKQDIFDQVHRSKKGGGPQKQGKGPPDCPRSDGMSPFVAMAFSGNEVYVRVNGSLPEGKCERLISVGGANYSMMTNASRTCGPAGEWKRRIVENISSVFFQGGFDWVKHDNDTIEVITEESGTFTVEVSELKYAELMGCWKYSCGCEQANNPAARYFFFTLLAIAVGGLGYDSFKMLSAKIFGKKPPKHVECKNGHRMEEVKLAERHFCDLCGEKGTVYQCSASCNYDLCKKCYKSEKKKVKAEWEKWVEKHPEDAKKKKSKKDDEDDDEDKKSDAAKSGDEGSTSKATDTESKAESEDKKSEKSGDDE